MSNTMKRILALVMVVGIGSAAVTVVQANGDGGIINSKDHL